MKNITLSHLNRPTIYAKVIDQVLRHASSCSLVVRSDCTPSDAEQRFLSAAVSDLRKTAERTEWPGTKLLDGTATVYWYDLTTHFQALFVASAGNLASWMHPDLPEDPAFYREDGSLLFGSVSHEGDAFLELKDDESDVFRHIAAETDDKDGAAKSGHPGAD
jgi:hypothetical protein